MQYLYMGECTQLMLPASDDAHRLVVTGFYIHSCQKMRYKGEYAPSFLADPEEYTWYPLEKCRPLLDKNHYAAFAHPEHSLTEPASEPSTSVEYTASQKLNLNTDPTPEFSEEVLAHTMCVAGMNGRTISVTPVTVCFPSRSHLRFSIHMPRTPTSGLTRQPVR